MAVRPCGIPNSGSGDTDVQINLLGDLQTWAGNGFLDILATNGHMRRLHRGKESLSRERDNRLTALADFFFFPPSLNVNEPLDIDRAGLPADPCPTCRQCRGRRKLRWIHTVLSIALVYHQMVISHDPGKYTHAAISYWVG